jgi:hypothetical protein
MSAPEWINWWSPGLQAMGGVVELAGAGLLAYEWWRASKEGIERANIDEHIISAEKIAEAAGIKDMRLIYDYADYKELRDKIPSVMKKLMAFRRRIYIVGFLFIIVGVIFQVAANGLAWGGAFGLFG